MANEGCLWRTCEKTGRAERGADSGGPKLGSSQFVWVTGKASAGT